MQNSAITFYGAAGEVTGSCHMVEHAGKQLLLDCGMVQGRQQVLALQGFQFAFSPAAIDAVVLSHAHLDHSGLLLLLVARGFDGPIICTPQTALLLPVLLDDALHLYLHDLDWQNKQRQRKGLPLLTPVIRKQDLYRVMSLVQRLPYLQQLELWPQWQLRLQDAGHILGSSQVEIWLQHGDVTKKILFSGDLGNPATVLMHDPAVISSADVVLMESTYGDRNHQPIDATLDEFATVLQQAHAAGGNVLIPAFALGRSQELIYYLALLYHQGRLPQSLVVLDSPMAIEITEIYNQQLHALDAKDLAPLKAHGGRDLADFLPILHATPTIEASMAINRIARGAIIIAGSGMCNGGRILHHFKHLLWKPNTSVVFVGYQATGTLGRQLIDGQTHIKVLGQSVTVQAKLHTIGGFSAHAGQRDLLAWAQHFPASTQFYLVHGEPTASRALQAFMQARGQQVEVAVHAQRVPLHF